MVESPRKEDVGVGCLAALAALVGQLNPHHRQALAALLPALLGMARLAAQPTQQADGTASPTW
ncbi:hypothetical protein [Streptomyces sp. NPDC048196]|uniref:hypothetical protein n=1 Tax=Streptomyces sp. NPDC048196 TaxID=3154712 RepID=UPI0033E97C1A